MTTAARLITASELDSRLTQAITEAMKAGLVVEDVKAVIERIQAILDDES